MRRKKEKSRHEGRELVGDPRGGKRVFCLSLFPESAVFGTIQKIVQYSNSVEYWEVLTDAATIIDGPSSSFVLYEQAPELHAGDRVKYALDKGGHLLGTVKEPVWAGDHLNFLIHFENGEQLVVWPQRCTKM